MPNEIELKLRIAAADIPRLRRHAAIKPYLAGKPVTRRLVSIYYDTPDLQLLDAAISLRVRRMSGSWFQAVKGAGHSVAGLHQRMEWEDIIAKGEPDFSKINLMKNTEPHLAMIFANPHLRDALRPIFTTDVKRTEWQLEYADGSAVEMALDIGELQIDKAPPGRKTEPIREIELELKRGNPHHLFALALALQADIPLHIENVSKAQRGYAFYRTSPPAISKACAVVLHKKTSVREAFQAAVAECLRHLQENHEMALTDETSLEGVHQMRIALRRLKAARKLFRGDDADLKQELRWLGTLLGTVRDWDVLRQETLPTLLQESMLDSGLPDIKFNSAESDDAESIALLQQRAQTTRKRAYAKLRRALASQRYQKLLLSLGAWLQSQPQAHDKNALKFIEHHLQKSHKKLQQQGKSLSGLTSEQLHKLRLQIKQLRYIADFFTAPKSSRKTMVGKRRYISRLMRLQQALGKTNDHAVAEKLLLKLCSGATNDHAQQALAIIRNGQAKSFRHAHKHTNKAWQALLAIKTGGN